MKRILAVFIALAFVVLIYFPREVRAYDCSVSISLSEAQPNTSVNINFSLTTNTGLVNWIKITKPFSGLTTTFVSASGFSADYTAGGDTITLSGGLLFPGSPLTIETSFDIGDIGGSSGNFTLVASTDGGGSSDACSTQSLGFSVTGEAADTTAPVISSVTVSNITSTSAKITWTTDEASTTKVNYGVEYAGPLNNNNTTLTTSHSVTITSGIGPSTTYYYTACSTDESGNEGCSSENNFTTSAASTSTPTPTTAATATPTPTATTATTTATPTPTVAPDTTAPEVEITTELEDSYEEAPLFEGAASDARGISSISYSTDGGANWLPVDDSEGTGEVEVTFSFTPRVSEDGNYDIRARAIDPSGNEGLSDIVTLVIDRLPPRVGGNLLTLGPLALLPNEDGVIVTLPGLEQRLTLSTVGGATSVDLLVGESISSLGFSPVSGLWTGALNLREPGFYQMRTRAVDGAGNKTERDLNSILVLDSGQVRDQDGDVVDEGKLTIFIQDERTRVWSLWDGATFGQENPQTLGNSGNYEFFLPPGTFFVTIESPGKPKTTSKIFRLDTATAFNADFELMPRRTLNFGPIKIPLPAFLSDKHEVTLNSVDTESIAKSSLIGEEMPIFTLPSTGDEFRSASLIGSKGVLSFISTWSPPALEQVAVLDEMFSSDEVEGAIVSVQENKSKVAIFRQRGSYEAPIVVDQDGELVEEFGVNSLPTHYFIDRRGVVQRVVTGVLSRDEFDEVLNDI